MTSQKDIEKRIQQYLDSFDMGVSDDVGISLEETVEYLFQSPSLGMGLNQFAFIFNMSTLEIERVCGVHKVLGYDESTFDFQVFHQNIHPDDLEKMMHATFAATNHVIEKQEQLPMAAQVTTTYRIKHADGRYMHLQDATSCLSVDKNDLPLKGICVCTDISQIPFVEVTASLSCPCNSFVAFESMSEKKIDFGFTKREMEIMKCIGEGKSSDEIGKKLYISKFTVDKHRSNILRKAGVKRTQELIQFFVNLPTSLM